MATAGRFPLALPLASAFTRLAVSLPAYRNKNIDSRESWLAGTFPAGAGGAPAGLPAPLRAVADRSAPIVATLEGDGPNLAAASASLAAPAPAV